MAVKDSSEYPWSSEEATTRRDRRDAILKKNWERTQAVFQEAQGSARAIQDAQTRQAILALIEAAAGISGSNLLATLGFDYEDPFAEKAV